MREGLENDDKYRLVEDELLSIAQRFTVHLHAAEYKKQQKMVQSQNAHTIKSISRPAVGVMPDHTKRQKEGAERAETQRKVLSGILKKTDKAEKSDDSDSADGLPYIGTTLHGLMDSPRRRGMLLSKFAPVTTKTRSAAGYKRPGLQSKELMQGSPVSKITSKQTIHSKTNTDTSSDEDDDLDAPVQAPKFFKREASVPVVVKASSSTKLVSQTKDALKPLNGSRRSVAGTAIKREKIDISTIKSTSSKVVSGDSLVKQANFGSSTPNNSLSKTVDPGMMMKQEGVDGGQDNDPDLSPPLFAFKRTRVSRFERARQIKAQQENEQKSQKTRDIIPSFL